MELKHISVDKDHDLLASYGPKHWSDKWGKMFLLIILGICIQGCSWFNSLQIKNTTDSTWKIKYEIISQKGVLRNKITIQDKSKKIRTIAFENNYIEFELAPKEIVLIGSSRNLYYEGYKNAINARNLVISNEKTSYEIEFYKLDDVLDKNSKNVARINISKLIRNSRKNNP